MAAAVGSAQALVNPTCHSPPHGTSTLGGLTRAAGPSSQQAYTWARHN